MENELISIIVPIFNVEQYLEKCVSSILGQTYSNIEVLLVDDESPDNCPAICDKFAMKDERVRVIHKKNGGISSARNAGIKAAKGEYIAFVDGDDFVSLDYLEVMYHALKENQADLVICNYIFVDESGSFIYNKSNIDAEILSKLEAQKKGLTGQWWNYIYTWNKLYKKQLFNDIAFPEGKIHEEMIVYQKLIYRCNKVVIIKDYLYNYVQRETSTMHTKGNIEHLDDFDILYESYKFISEKHLDELKPLMLDMFWNQSIVYRKDIKPRNRYERVRIKEVNNIFKIICNENRSSIIFLKRFAMCHPFLLGFVSKLSKIKNYVKE